MKFKEGDLVVVERYFSLGHDAVENIVSEIHLIKEIKYNACFERCQLGRNCNGGAERLFKLKDMRFYNFCEYELRHATDREKFLYYMHGSNVLK